MAALAKKPAGGSGGGGGGGGWSNDDNDAGDDFDYDSDDNPVAKKKKTQIAALPPVDHATQRYEPFRKVLYTPHPVVQSKGPAEVEELKAELGCTVTGAAPPCPIQSFMHANFSDRLVRAILQDGFEAPTVIQSCSLPAAMSGRDVIGMAPTGSGKTLSFLWPMLIHIFDQRKLSPGEGPVGLVLAPTRELAEQIYRNARRYIKCFGDGRGSAVAVFGGAGKWEMAQALRAALISSWLPGPAHGADTLEDELAAHDVARARRGGPAARTGLRASN